MKQISAGQKIGEILFYLVTYPLWISWHKYQLHKIRTNHEKEISLLKLMTRAEARSGRYQAAKGYFTRSQDEQFLSIEQLLSIFRKPLEK
ncbi:MAG: hypothetical protein E5Y74_00055 [Mesorhizobium sp.]|nr:MAG: hypothetical protein E5Y74_00055 [Mesorhizobium sp.]